MTRYDYEQQLGDERRRHEEYADHREVIHPRCTHKDRPNILSLPSLPNPPFMCRACWDLRFKDRPLLPVVRRGHTYRRTIHRDGEWRQEEI